MTSDAKIRINVDGRVIMMSSDYIQKSYEDSINRQGFFTKLLIDGLNGNAANNGIITALSLHDYISSEIEKIDLPEKQTPVLDVRIAGRFILNKMENTVLSTENGIISLSRQQGVERSIGSKYDLFDESKKILSDTYIGGDNLFTIANFGLMGLHIQLSTGIPIYTTAVEREKALINRAINQLLKYELVEPAGKEGGVMRLTENGIEIAEEIYFSEDIKSKFEGEHATANDRENIASSPIEERNKQCFAEFSTYLLLRKRIETVRADTEEYQILEYDISNQFNKYIRLEHDFLQIMLQSTSSEQRQSKLNLYLTEEVSSNGSCFTEETCNSIISEFENRTEFLSQLVQNARKFQTKPIPVYKKSVDKSVYDFFISMDTLYGSIVNILSDEHYNIWVKIFKNIPDNLK